MSEPIVLLQEGLLVVVVKTTRHPYNNTTFQRRILQLEFNYN